MFAKPGGFGYSRAPPEIDPCLLLSPRHFTFLQPILQQVFIPNWYLACHLNTLSASPFAPEGPTQPATL